MGREEGLGWGTHVYLWQIHFDIWQNQYNIVKLNKIKLKKKKSRDIILVTKSYSESYGFSGSHVRMLDLDHKEP